MSPDAAELDRRISELDAVVEGLPEGSAERRAARVELAAWLAARYIQHNGAEEDRIRAERTGRDVLDDPGATANERQAMSVLLPTLTMLTITPAAALRGRDPGPTADTLRLTEQWRQAADPAATLAGLAELAGQWDSIEDVDSLPPPMRSNLAMIKAVTGLFGDAQRPDWDGQIAPEVMAPLRDALAGAHPDVPGLDLLRGLVTWLDTPGPRGGRDPVSPGGRVAELEAAIVGLSGDHLLTPVLQRDLAQALVTGPELGKRPDALRRATELMEQASVGMAEDHPFHSETVRMLAGALVATAAVEPTDERLARAEQVAADVLRRSQGTGPADRGADLFLRSLVGLLRGRADGDRHAGTAVHHLVAAIELLPVDHALRQVAVGQLGAVLADRHLMEGLLEDADAAVYLLDRAVKAVSTGADDGSGTFIACLAAMAKVIRAIRLDDSAAVVAEATAFRAELARLPDEHMMRSNFELVLAIAGLRSAVTDRDGVRPALDVVRRVTAGGTLIGVPPGVVAVLVDCVDVLGGLLDADPAAMVNSINRMEADLTESVAFPDQQAGQRALLGKAYLAAIDIGIHPDVAADRAVTHLEQARRLFGDHRAGVPLGDVLRDLASAYRARGDREMSRRVAIEALEAHAGDVLLQSGVAHAVLTARGASTDASVLARWFLADGEVTGAVQALELGRGLALHAATSALRVPALLARVARPELAEAWQRDADARRDAPAPWGITAIQQSADPAAPPAVDHARAASDLRHRVLDVLRGTTEGARLFTAPSTEAVGQALSVVDGDVLAYLLPGDETVTGHILMIGRNGETKAVDAPRLLVETDGALATYLRTPQSGDGGEAAVWHAALERVCDWAGSAVLEPLLGALDGSRGGEPDAVLRVVLVPGGALGAVPWHAARLPGGSTGMRYACADLVLSTAASARQFLDVTSRLALPLDLEPVLVSVPTGDLFAAPDEVLTLRDVFYPDAVLLGDLDGLERPDGTGTPEELLSRLPGVRSLGASLLHLSCHARTADTAEASHLALTTPLSIRVVLEHAAGRAVDTPGPTVVLSACVSDLTVQDYDEALTLATAFLASGAVTVVGSRWKVHDQLTSILMFVFHHFLAASGQTPADALRSAQLWMLDPDRAELPGMPIAMMGDIDVSDLTDVAIWAAFGHHGK